MDIFLSNVPCFCAGTCILTDRGHAAVEHLAIGQRIVTAAGPARRIEWIGYRRLDLARHPAPEQAQPILIRADAFADGVPRRDLRLSPDHAVLISGVLVPVRLLVNGASIRRDTESKAVAYYHIELATHDILLAENLPAETYLDTGNRDMFENAAGPLLLHPDFDDGQRRRVAGSCRPFIDEPAAVEPIWRHLAMRAADLNLALRIAPETTRDPDLRVVAGNHRIAPITVGASRRHVFVCRPLVLPFVSSPRRHGPAICAHGSRTAVASALWCPASL